MFSSTRRWLCRINGKTRKATRAPRSGLKPRLEVLEDRALLSVQILFDYSHDTNGFFTLHPEAKAILQDAANDLTSRLSTSTPLLAIHSSGSNSWTATPFDPANPAQTLSIPDLSVPQDGLVVFVGGSNLPGIGERSVSGPGGSHSTGDSTFLATVRSRGQTGFAPWGGSISFDMNPSDKWYFGLGSSVPQGQGDFFSVATHELGHLLGIGTSPQWQSLVLAGTFIGLHSQAANNNKPVPLDQLEPQHQNAHWANGVMSTLPDGSAQQAVMDPILLAGTRTYFTSLDYAGLQDLGWQVQPGNAAKAPSITTQPTNQTVTEGESATFTAAASGSPTPAVQWEVSTNGAAGPFVPVIDGTLADGTLVSGSSTPTLTLSNVSASVSGNVYEAIFNNSAGNATTNTVTLTVKAPTAPVITANPSNQTVTVGQNATFTASATGNPTPTVQWQVSSDGGKTFSNISGATNTTLKLTSVTPSMNGNEYQAVFSNSAGSATTSAATLTLPVSSPSISANPASKSVVVGQSVSFTASAIGNPTPTVQWQVSSDGGKTFSNISGATSSTLTLNNVTRSMNGDQYEAVFTNSAGTATSTAATLTVSAAPPSPPPAPPPSQPPAPPPLPVLHTPPLLAFLNSLLGAATETVNADRSITVTNSFFGFPLLVSTYDASGNFVSATLLGIILPSSILFL